MGISNAIEQSAVSRTTGYALDFRDTQTAAGGVKPVRVAVLTSISATTEMKKITNATRGKVIDTFGNCAGVEIVNDLATSAPNIPVDVIAVPLKSTAQNPVESAKIEINFSEKENAQIGGGFAKIIINGRYTAAVAVKNDMTAAQVAAASAAQFPNSADDTRSLNPVFASVIGEKLTLTAKFGGVLGNQITAQVSISDGGLTADKSGAILHKLSGGVGNVDLDNFADYLNEQMGDIWYDFVVNPFGEILFDEFQKVNGTPSDDGGTGRWNARRVIPFVAISASNSAVCGDLTAMTTGRGDDLTNVLTTAPNSANADYLIAAAWASLAAKQANTKPYLDIMGKKLPNITLFGEEIGEMSQYSIRDELVKNGVSTVQYDRAVGGYVVQDFVTFRRMPDQSETAKDWRFVRDIIIDFNVAFNYQILQNRTLIGKVIVRDGETIQADRRGDVLYLSVWKSAVINFIEQMISLAYITDFEYSKNSLLVEISGNNPKRINTQFAYKRTSVANIASTTAYAGFSFGLEA